MCKSDKGSSCDCNMPPPKITGPYYSFTIEYPVATVSFDGTYLEWHYLSDLAEDAIEVMTESVKARGLKDKVDNEN